jgi:hypothetical protein
MFSALIPPAKLRIMLFALIPLQIRTETQGLAEADPDPANYVGDGLEKALIADILRRDAAKDEDGDEAE